VALGDEREIQQVREAIAATGASFFFVLTWNEFTATYPDDAPRRRRRYLALTDWADISGGELVLVRDLDDIGSLQRELSVRGSTRYRLGVNPSEPVSDADIEVTLRDRPNLNIHALD
jgi:hypothetical protein